MDLYGENKSATTTTARKKTETFPQKGFLTPIPANEIRKNIYVNTEIVHGFSMCKCIQSRAYTAQNSRAVVLLRCAFIRLFDSIERERECAGVRVWCIYSCSSIYFKRCAPVYCMKTLNNEVKHTLFITILLWATRTYLCDVRKNMNRFAQIQSMRRTCFFIWWHFTWRMRTTAKRSIDTTTQFTVNTVRSARTIISI